MGAIAIIGQAEVALKPDVSGFGQDVEGKLKSVIGALPAPIAAIAGVGLAVGGTLFAIGEHFEASFHKIQVGTGATGEQLKGLDESFKKVLAGTGASFDTVSAAIVGLSQKTGLSGPPLEKLAKQYVDLGRITKTDVAASVKEATQVFNRFGIAAKDQGPALDVLFKASQASGTSITDLSGTLAKTQPILGAMGLSFAQQTAIVAGFGKEGIKSQAVVMGLGKEFANLAKKGQDPVKGISDFVKSIKEAATPTAALEIATAKLGARAGPELATAVRSGAFSIDALTKTLTNGQGGIEATAAATETIGVKFSKLKNTVLVALEPIATKVLELVTQGIDVVIGALPTLESIASQVFGQIRSVVEPVIAAIVPIAQDVFPKLVAAGKDVADFIGGHLKESMGALIGVLALLLIPLGAYVISMVAAAAATVIAAAPFIAIAALAAGIGYGIVYAYTHFKVFRDVIEGVVKFITGSVVPFLTTAFNVIKEVITTVIGIITKLWSAFGHDLLDIAKTLIGLVTTFFRTAFQVFVDIVKVVVDLITGDWQGALNALLDIVKTVGRFIADAFKAVFNIVGDLIDGFVKVVKAIGPKVVEFFKGLPGMILDALGDLGGILLNAGGKIIDGLINGIKGAFGKVKDVLGSVTDLIPSWKGPPGKDVVILHGAGRLIMEGLSRGIMSGLPALQATLGGVSDVVSGTSFGVAGTGASGTFGGGSGGSGSGDVAAMLADLTAYLKSRDPVVVNNTIHSTDPVMSARETVDALRSAQFRAGR